MRGQRQGLARLERYRDIVPDWDAFVASAAKPVPTAFWVNTFKSERARALCLLSNEGVAARPSLLGHDAFVCDPAVKLGLTLPYIAGLIQPQEEIAMLPVMAADIRPGMRVLDLCAAPGNKTLQAAIRVGRDGSVVANDSNPGRLRIVQSALERLGLANVLIVRHDGGSFPAPRDGLFDVVIADVPCSGEGMIRRYGWKCLDVADQFRSHLPVLQKVLLQRAFALCRPGGAIVYSTCTFAPEENECVVDALLECAGDQVTALGVPLPAGFRCCPGVVEWAGRRLHPACSRAVRFWPHLNDTGGFFVALFRKSLSGAVEMTS